MKVLLYARNGQYPNEIETAVKNAGLEIVPSSTPSLPSFPFDVIITYGGDGTLLGAERDFPGVPKLPLKDSGIGYHTIKLPVEETLKDLTENKLTLKEYSKLELNFNGKKYLALNEIAIRNQLATSALRFSLYLERAQRVERSRDSSTSLGIKELIGDGVIISTPFGSSGYFYSIAHKIFDSGIGIAFNNTHNIKVDNQIISETETVSVTILRGPGELTLDNNPEILTLKDNEEVEIKKSSNIAKIYTL